MVVFHSESKHPLNEHVKLNWSLAYLDKNIILRRVGMNEHNQ